MQRNITYLVHKSNFFLLPILIFTVFLPSAGRAGDATDVKTTVRKVPYPAAPETERPKKIKLETAFQRWSVKVTWDKLHGNENGFEARFVTADVIAGLANQLAKEKQLTDAQAQALYEERRRKYYGDADQGAFGAKLAFLGHIELNSETYTAGQLNASWQFELLTEGGKPLAPAKVEMGDVRLQKSGPAGLASWYRAFTVTFENLDPLSKRRFATAGVPSLTLVVKGPAGEGRATYVFDPAAR
jgi:hypothetical protein